MQTTNLRIKLRASLSIVNTEEKKKKNSFVNQIEEKKKKKIRRTIVYQEQDDTSLNKIKMNLITVDNSSIN